MIDDYEKCTICKIQLPTYLHDNPICDEGADLLFKDLKDNNSLSMINLCRCNIKLIKYG